MTETGETESAPDRASNREASPSPWRRVVVKLSGEALMGGESHGLDMGTLTRIAADLSGAAALGVEVAVVVGGGNFFRGIAGADKGIERARADSIGMLATVMNALALEYAIEKQGQSGAGALRRADAFAVRTFFPAGRTCTTSQGAHRGSGRGHRQSVLHHRHRGGACAAPNCPATSS